MENFIFCVLGMRMVSGFNKVFLISFSLKSAFSRQIVSIELERDSNLIDTHLKNLPWENHLIEAAFNKLRCFLPSTLCVSLNTAPFTDEYFDKSKSKASTSVKVIANVHIYDVNKDKNQFVIIQFTYLKCGTSCCTLLCNPEVPPLKLLAPSIPLLYP